MSLSLTTSDWMMVTRLIYCVNCIDSTDAYPHEVLRLLRPVIPFSGGILNLLQGEADTAKAAKISGLQIPEEVLASVTENELDGNLFLRSLCFNFSAKVSRGPSRAELNKKEGAGADLFPADVQHALTVILQFKDELLGYLILLRSDGEAEFSRRDTCVLEELCPHLSLQLAKLRSGHSPAAIDRILSAWEVPFRSYGLSRKEIEVIYYFYQGLTDAEICEKLFISKSTFKKHVNHIYQKMELNNRVSLLKCVEGALRKAR